jgi:hypothetical protein
MWEPRRLTILWSPRPVTGIALPFFTSTFMSIHPPIYYSRIHLYRYIFIDSSIYSSTISLYPLFIHPSIYIHLSISSNSTPPIQFYSSNPIPSVPTNPIPLVKSHPIQSISFHQSNPTLFHQSNPISFHQSSLILFYQSQSNPIPIPFHQSRPFILIHLYSYTQHICRFIPSVRLRIHQFIRASIYRIIDLNICPPFRAKHVASGMTFPHEPHNGNISCLASCLVELLLPCVHRASNCWACLRQSSPSRTNLNSKVQIMQGRSHEELVQQRRKSILQQCM